MTLLWTGGNIAEHNQLLPKLWVGRMYSLSAPFQFKGWVATECKLVCNNFDNDDDNIAHNNITNNNIIANNDIYFQESKCNSNNITYDKYCLQQHLYDTWSIYFMYNNIKSKSFE